MNRLQLLALFVPMLLAAQSEPAQKNHTLNPTSRRATPDAGRLGSPTRRPLASQLPAPEYPVTLETKRFRERPKANVFNGEVIEEISIGSEFQTPITAADADTGSQGTDEDIATIKAPPRVDPRATLSAPSSGATLGSSATFAWTPGSQATRYWLTVGSCSDCADIADRDMGLTRSVTINLPTDGRVLYASIFTSYAGAWFWNDYQFRASGSNSAVPSALTSPSNGSTLANPQSFSWNTGSGVDFRWFNVGSCTQCNDIFDGEISERFSVSVNIPQDGRVIFVTVWSLIQGDWYTRDYQFRAPPGVETRIVRANVTNQLKYAINVSINDRVVGSVPAGETRYVEDSVGSSMTVSWDLVRPTLSGRALGDVMGGRYNTIYNPSGSYNFTADYIIGDSQFFRPLFTNRSATALLMEVNGGSASQNRCECTAAAASTNVHSGYYKLFSNSNFRVYRSTSNYTGAYLFWGTNSDGRVSSGGEIWRNVAQGSGEITFTTSTAP